MVIRKGGIGDIGILAGFWLALMAETYPEYASNVDWWRAETIDLMENDPGYFCFVAEKSGFLVGFTDGVAYKDSAWGETVAWSRHTYILPEYRGGGTTKSLFGAVYDHWRREGLKKVLFSCPDHLIPYYLKHGYRKVENIMMGDV